MLMYQKSCMEAIRALLYQTYYYVDLSHEATDPVERQCADNMFMINNPLCKAYASDMAWILTQEAIQFMAVTASWKSMHRLPWPRDCKIYSLWEGTNFIQAQDFTGRKFTMSDGEPFRKWLAQIATFVFAEKTPEFAAEFKMLEDALTAFNSIAAMNADWNKNDIRLKQLFATRTMHAAARVYCGKLMLSQALLAAGKLAELETTT
jgi:hypothetical protein